MVNNKNSNNLNNNLNNNNKNRNNLNNNNNNNKINNKNTNNLNNNNRNSNNLNNNSNNLNNNSNNLNNNNSNNLNNNNSNNLNNNNNSTKTNNNKFNEYLNSKKEDIKKIKKFKDDTVNNINAMPSQLKIFNVVLGFILMYVFTNVKYNIYLSILFAVITSILIYIFGGAYLSLIFIVLYSIYLMKIINTKYKNAGIIINQTNIYKTSDGLAMMCDKPQTPENNIISYKNFRDEVDNRDFSICVFLYINGSNPKYKNNFKNYRFRDWKSIFYFGQDEIIDSSTNDPIELKDLKQIPGLWLKPTLNNLVLVINDGQNNGLIELDDVPLNEWFSVSIILNNSAISLYKNCKLEKIITLNSFLPETSEYNLYIANDGKLIKYNDSEERNGFPGQMAFFTYYNFSLSQTAMNEYCSTYSSILNNYQYKQNNDIKYETSCLVTDSDKNSL